MLQKEHIYYDTLSKERKEINKYVIYNGLVEQVEMILICTSTIMFTISLNSRRHNNKNYHKN